MLGSLSGRVNTFLLALVVLMAAAIIGILATRAGAGSLDPPGAPASTMHTLDDVYSAAQNVPPAWDQKLDSANGSGGSATLPAGCNSDRFLCVFRRVTGVLAFTYDGVLDRETGLVWQRVPSSGTTDWVSAGLSCGRANTGGREGWRLPTEAEILSLQDDSVSVGPHLPPGNPFAGTFTSFFWTSTEDLQTPANADVVVFGLDGNSWAAKTLTTIGYWCVRGPTSNR